MKRVLARIKFQKLVDLIESGDYESIFNVNEFDIEIWVSIIESKKLSPENVSKLYDNLYYVLYKTTIGMNTIMMYDALKYVSLRYNNTVPLVHNVNLITDIMQNNVE